MDLVERSIRRGGLFLRRRDLLALGHSDAQIRLALARRAIFRVRHGWYSVPSAPRVAVRAVRVGGRLTGIAALETYGLRVPRRPTIEVAVPVNACRLRRPDDRRERLRGDDDIAIRWVDSRRERHGSRWRVTLDDALLAVIEAESRDVAIACASAVMRFKRWSPDRMRRVFDRAPRRCHCWLALVSAMDESHGETFVRLWLRDAGITVESQPRVDGVGRLDFRAGPNTYIEVDGGQHDPGWTGEGASSYEADHDRDTEMAKRHARVLRWTYRQIYSRWSDCLAALRVTLADDLELEARRAQRPTPPRVLRKRRRSGADPPRNDGADRRARKSPSF